MSFPFLVIIILSIFPRVLHLLESQIHISPLYSKDIHPNLDFLPAFPSAILSSHHPFQYTVLSLNYSFAGFITFFCPLSPPITIQALCSLFLNLGRKKKGGGEGGLYPTSFGNYSAILFSLSFLSSLLQSLPGVNLLGFHQLFSLNLTFNKTSNGLFLANAVNQ